MSVDLSTTPADGATRILLSVGQGISVRKGDQPKLHVYYIQSTNKVNVGFFNNYNQYGNVVLVLEDTKLVLRLDKNGAYLNGSLLTEAVYGDRAGYYKDALAQLMALDTVLIGAVEGNYKSCATYEYIRIGTE